MILSGEHVYLYTSICKLGIQHIPTIMTSIDYTSLILIIIGNSEFLIQLCSRVPVHALQQVKNTF